MEKNSMGNVNDNKLANVMLKILEAEQNNLVKKASRAAMIDKIYKLIIQEVDKK